MALPSKDELRERIAEEWDELSNRFPGIRLCLISRDPTHKDRLVVEKATPEQLEKWPGLVDRVCWEYVNPFKQKCLWCPISESMDSGEIKFLMARSPKPISAPGKETIYDLESPEMEYAALVAIPMGADATGKQYALELSIGQNKEASEEKKQREKRQQWSAAIADTIAGHADDEVVTELILFGAVARPSLGWENARLLVLNQAYDSYDKAVVASVLRLRKPKDSASLEKAEARFEPRTQGGECDVDALRPDLLAFVERESGLDDKLTVEELMAREGFNLHALKPSPLTLPIAVRTSCRKAVVCVTEGSDRVHSVLLAECSEDTLVSEDDLADLTMYALFISEALARRIFQKCAQARGQILQKVTGIVGPDAESVALAAGMIVGFTHDLNKAYTGITSWANTIVELVPRNEGWKNLKTDFLKNVSFGKTLLDRIVKTTTMAHPEPESFSLPKETRAVLAEEDSTLKGHGVDCNLVCRLLKEDLLVSWDRLMYRMVLFNLLNNADYWLRKYRRPPRRIEVRLIQTVAERVVIEVLDNGPGIPAEARPRVFEPFFSLKRSEEGGMGVGLNIIKRMAVGHGGMVGLFNESGWKGACIRIDMPVTGEIGDLTHQKGEGQI